MNQEALSDYYLTERRELVSFLKRHGPFSAALDIGCASGAFGAGLVREGITTACDGIEPHAEAANVAATNLRQAWHGTLESQSGIVPWQDYDLVTMADVMEHLVDPWAALRLLHARTAASCRLLLSVPNVRHYKVVLPLLFKGEFRYADEGIMDRTHLHFFTRESLLESLHDCGWREIDMGSHMKKRYRKTWLPTRWLEPFVAVQHFVIAEKA
jgi:2-polyprenyl-3-methyl-5-hydroxy-6-metoxy-1,4-benzoquinol methylase